MSYLSRDRPDVRRMLAWAEVQSREGLEAGSVAQAGVLGVRDLEAVNYVLYHGVKSIITDSLLGRARALAWALRGVARVRPTVQARQGPQVPRSASVP